MGNWHGVDVYMSSDGFVVIRFNVHNNYFGAVRQNSAEYYIRSNTLRLLHSCSSGLHPHIFLLPLQFSEQVIDYHQFGPEGYPLRNTKVTAETTAGCGNHY